MPSECCDEYKLIKLYQKSSVWCFAFSHTSTFELIPAVATAQPGSLVTLSLFLLKMLSVMVDVLDVVRVKSAIVGHRVNIVETVSEEVHLSSRYIQ